MTTLPLELEREIFEICAFSQPTCIPKLVLVAKHVKDWVEPVFYRIIILGAVMSDFPLVPYDIMSALIRRKPPAFFHSAVRHLLVYIPHQTPQELESILSVCTGVEDLWIDDMDNAFIPLIHSFPLKRLCVAFDNIPAPSQTLPMFSCLTHLHLRAHYGNDEPSILAFVEALPKLTHLGFTHLSWIGGRIYLPMLHRLLESSPLMRVLVIFKIPGPSWPDEAFLQLRWDLRFVVMPYRDFVADWDAGVQHGRDYWADAEAFIAKRRTREIDPLKYSWP
ncbi:hypothetical protein C8R45DRAFT_638733 [Mycena sanguinolenta]|nr:hypothetical protein C8R45DRAFT_638733 [Mycena sanguinolenta]